MRIQLFALTPNYDAEYETHIRYFNLFSRNPDRDNAKGIPFIKL